MGHAHATPHVNEQWRERWRLELVEGVAPKVNMIDFQVATSYSTQTLEKEERLYSRLYPVVLRSMRLAEAEQPFWTATGILARDRRHGTQQKPQTRRANKDRYARRAGDIVKKNITFFAIAKPCQSHAAYLTCGSSGSWPWTSSSSLKRSKSRNQEGTRAGPHTRGSR